MPGSVRFGVGSVIDAVKAQLGHEPGVETRNRKPLRQPLPELPEASWELRIHGDLRVLYWIVDTKTVTVLRVILKGTGTLIEAEGTGRER